MGAEDRAGSFADVDRAVAASVGPISDLACEAGCFNWAAFVVSNSGEVEMGGGVVGCDGLGDLCCRSGAFEVSSGEGVGGEDVGDVDDAGDQVAVA